MHLLNNLFRLRTLAIVLTCAGLIGAWASAAAQQLLVSAAASLTNVLPVIANQFQKEHSGITVRLNFAASGALVQQIEQGAPVDVFISAAQTQMDRLQEKGLVTTATRANICGDEIVVIAPRSSGMRDWQGLADGGIQRIAISDPASVPSGAYAMQTLQSLGLWDKLRSKFVYGENVRQTLAYIDGNNVDAAIVYLTDARVATRPMIVLPAPSGTHGQITFPAAVIARSREQAAAAMFVQYLLTPFAQNTLHDAGFAPAR